MKYLFFLIIFGAFASCVALDNASPVEAAVTLVDFKGQPLKNRVVFVEGYGTIRKEQLTDDKGQTQLNFNWDGYNESGTSVWAIQAVEDTSFKMTNLLFSPNGGHGNSRKYTIADTIRMDTLRPLKIRVKTNRTDLEYLRLQVSYEGIGLDRLKSYGGFYSTGTQTIPVYRDSPSWSSYYWIKQPVNRSFVNHGKTTTTPQLDTTFQTRVFAHTNFKILCLILYKNTPKENIKELTFNPTVSRDSVLLLAF
ncbi:MAG: hypothetical protein U5L45_08150 [Saprospiraceae bacterium]|nr:hypothetical protein [Saprospiraceae bacterium]